MKLAIDIPEEYRGLYETEKCKSKFDSLATNEFGYVLRKAFESGTPLPKGHGRLIDADDVKENHRRWIGYLDEDMIARLNIAIDKHVPTIVEADKEK